MPEPRWPALDGRTVDAARFRSRLARSRPSGLRHTAPSLKTRVTRGEWRPRVQLAAIRRGGMAAATAWRSGTYGRAVPFPKPDRSIPPRQERAGRPHR